MNITAPRPQADRFEAGALRPAAAEIRRAAWAALSDLGMSDEEIAAYYGIYHANSPARGIHTVSGRRITPL